MQKLLWATAALVLSLSAAQAQNKVAAPTGAGVEQAPVVQPDQAEKKMVKDPQTRANHMADRIAKQFSLSSADREQVYAVFIRQFEQVDALHTDPNRREKVKAIRQETDAKLKGILGADNYAKYQQMRQDKRNARQDQ